MKLSVVIPCYNAARTITGQLEALASQKWSEPWELIVADNGSTDDSVAIVKSYQARVPALRIVDASDRQGAAHARNAGAQVACGHALAFCDADDEVGSGWLAAMGQALSRDPFVAGRMEMAKLNPSWVTEAYGRHPQEVGLQRIWYPPYLPHAGGSTLGVQRAVHEMVGGFDESLPYLEDTEYCFRIQRTGIGMTFVADAVVHVRLRGSCRDIFRQGRCWARYNVLLYKRYRPSGTREYGRWLDHMRNWAGLLWRLVKLRRQAEFRRWVWQCAWQIGRLEGSLRFGVPPV
jgi:glycosyltransferase involved in cell wall biosynthesis